jgi:hypothetical protein
MPTLLLPSGNCLLILTHSPSAATSIPMLMLLLLPLPLPPDDHLIIIPYCPLVIRSCFAHDDATAA